MERKPLKRSRRRADALGSGFRRNDEGVGTAAYAVGYFPVPIRGRLSSGTTKALALKYPSSALAPSGGVLTHRQPRGGHNRVCVDACLGQQVLGSAGTGQIPHRQLDDARPGWSIGQGFQNRVAQAAFRPVVFHRDDRPLGSGGGFQQRILIDRLDGVQVDYSGADALLLQTMGGM